MDKKTTDVLRKLDECLWRAETRFDDELMQQTFAADFLSSGNLEMYSRVRNCYLAKTIPEK
jgi:hypothetical protein